MPKPGAEREVQREAITFLRDRGWIVINTSGAWSSARGMRGVPDLICHYDDNTVYVEVKGYDTTQLRKTQERWLERIRSCFGPHLQFKIVNNQNLKEWKKEMEALET